MRRILVAMVGLGVAISSLTAPSTPSERPVAQRTTAATPGTIVVVKARIWMKRGTVRIERHSGHRWRLVKRAKVRNHRFAVKVRQRARVAKYRARAGRRHSRTITVRITSPMPPARAPSSAPPPFPFNLTSGLLTGLTAPTTSSPPSSSSIPGAPSDGCGAQPIKADGTWWSCTFDAEFSTTALNRSKWLPATAFTMGSPQAHACYLDDPQNVSVSGGALHLTVRRVTTPVTCKYQSQSTPSSYTGGSVMTYRLFSQQYGRFETRMRTTSTNQPGLQESFWLWPDDRVASSVLWPAAGEIDIAETYSQYPTLAIPFLHYTANDNGGAIPGLNTAWTCGARRGLFNTYTLEWSPTTLKILVNGSICLVNTSADPAFQKPYIISLTAGLGQGANALTANTPLPATLDVDYVRVWQ